MTFPILKSLEEARATREMLVGKLQHVEVELGNKDQRLPNGQRMNPIAYHRWRQTKLQEKLRLVEHLRYVKSWIHTKSQATTPAIPDTKRYDPEPDRTRVQKLERVYVLARTYIDLCDDRDDPNMEKLDSSWEELKRAVKQVN